MTWWVTVRIVVYGRVGQIIGIVSLRRRREINRRWLKDSRDSFRITPNLPNHQKQPTKKKRAVTYPRPRNSSVLSVSDKCQGLGNTHTIQVRGAMGEFIWRRRHLPWTGRDSRSGVCQPHRAHESMNPTAPPGPHRFQVSGFCVLRITVNSISLLQSCSFDPQLVSLLET